MSGTALGRLQEERKQWRKDRPVGFVAAPRKNPDGSLNLMIWDCAVPGKRGTPWEGGLYKIQMAFGHNYPERAPSFIFKPPIFHPNVCLSSGNICVSIPWTSALSVKQLLLCLQEFLHTPNCEHGMNHEAIRLMICNVAEYNKRIRDQAVRFRDPNLKA